MTIDRADSIICYCRAVPASVVAQAAPSASSLAELCSSTGAGVTCFGCVLEVEELYERARGADNRAHTVRANGSFKDRLRDVRRDAKWLLASRAPQYFVGRLPTHRQAAWYAEDSARDLHSRVVVCNLPLPEIEAFRAAPQHLRLEAYSPAGDQLAARQYEIGMGQTLSVEFSSLLPEALTKPAHGVVLLSFVEPQLGCSRAYVQWYSSRAITSTHEKLWAKGEGYYLLTKVPQLNHLRLYWVIANPSAEPYRADFVLVRDGAELQRSPVTVGPRCSDFSSLDEIFPDYRAVEGLERASVLLDGPNLGAFCYYLVHNIELGTWQAQHL